MSIHASLIVGFDFSHGKLFAKEIWSKFHSMVHSSPRSCYFMTVDSSSRANFRLEENIVGIALEAALGGYRGEFLVSS
jgi:hypothetical protein